MRKTHLLLVIVGVMGSIFTTTTLVNATGSEPDKPAWIGADGRLNISKLPDNAKIPYKCWSGKTASLDGKAIKKLYGPPPMPGTPEYANDIAKTQELEKSSGVSVATDSDGHTVMNIDDKDAEVQRIMKKYEAKEIMQCQ